MEETTQQFAERMARAAKFQASEVQSKIAKATEHLEELRRELFGIQQRCPHQTVIRSPRPTAEASDTARCLDCGYVQ